MRDRFGKNGKTSELHIGPDDGAAATLVVTSATPDEARLAVLNLDVTAENVRGQHLRWDSEAETWRPGKLWPTCSTGPPLPLAAGSCAPWPPGWDCRTKTARASQPRRPPPTRPQPPIKGDWERASGRG